MRSLTLLPRYLRVLTGGRISGRRSRHEERKALVVELDEAVEEVRRNPYSRLVSGRLDRAADAIKAFDRKHGSRVSSGGSGARQCRFRPLRADTRGPEGPGRAS